MPFYSDHIYPQLVDKLGDPPPIQKVRQQIIPLAQGKVLEIGVGSGANFIHYDPTKVNKLYALESNLGMIRLAEKQQAKTKLNIEYLDLPGERIPLEDGTIDTVVSTFTLCTIPGIVDAIRGVIPGLISDTGYSSTDRARWLSDRADGDGIFDPISEVLTLLLVGLCSSAYEFLIYYDTADRVLTAPTVESIIKLL